MTAWLRLVRASNLTTVVSNAVGGVAVAAAIRNNAPVPLLAVLDAGFLVIVGGVLLYAAGTVMNDLADQKIDAAERPDRPLPSGRIGRRAALIACVACFIGANLVFNLFDAQRVLGCSTGLIFLILIYNTVHTRTAAAVGVIAACRGLLVLLALFTVLPAAALGWAWLYPVAATIYTLGLSLYARREVQRGREPQVARLIAAMPLVDAAACLTAGAHEAALLCVALALLTAVLQRLQPGA